jgi:hypothetical protein
MGQGAQFGAALARGVEVRTARGQQAELQRHLGEARRVLLRVAARHHLDGLSAVALEVGQQRQLLVGREAVARRVGDHRHAAGAVDPAQRVAQAGPAVWHETRLALGEEAAEHLGHVAAMAGLDQPAREMRAADQLRVADEFQRPLVGTADADRGQPGRHVARPRFAAAARGGQTLAQLGIVLVEAQADDVHHLAGEADRDFHPAQKGQTLGPRRSARARHAAHLVVVGQRPQLHPTGTRPRRQLLGLAGAVTHRGVAVQVGVGERVEIHGTATQGTAQGRPKPCQPPRGVASTRSGTAWGPTVLQWRSALVSGCSGVTSWLRR